MSIRARCARCDWSYPEHMLHRMIGGLINGDVCGICALDMTNAVHGTNRTTFQGERAEESRLFAEDWRERRKECAPMKTKNWYDMTPDECEARNREHLKRVAEAESRGPQFCRQTEGHACSSWCGYCGRCCDCRQPVTR